jgi:transcriptional regulator with XRE-family HTH domain
MGVRLSKARLKPKTFQDHAPMDGELSLYPQRKTTYPEIGTPELRRQIGKELKSAREFQEMSLEQVMAFTKINIRFLENIEEGKWNFLPPTYVKAFIRAYSSAVGLQTDKLTNRLDELFQHVVVAAAVFKPYLSNDPDNNETSSRSKGFLDWVEQHRALLFYGLIGVIATVLVAIYLFRHYDTPTISEDEKTDSTAIVAPIAVIKPETTQVGSTVNTALGTDSTLTRKTMSMEFSFLDSCFVKVEFSDSVLYDKTHWPGNDLTLDTPYPIRLSLGNAPMTRLKINGQQLPVFPGSRRVQIVNLGPGGIIG